MFAVQKFTRVAPQACRLAVQKRCLLSAPPRNRVPFPEKVAHGVVIALSAVAIPVWVLTHLQEYKGAPEPED